MIQSTAIVGLKMNKNGALGSYSSSLLRLVVRVVVTFRVDLPEAAGQYRLRATVEDRHVNAPGILSKRWPVDVCPGVSSAVVDYMANPTSHRQHQHQGHVFVYFFLACKKCTIMFGPWNACTRKIHFLLPRPGL